MYDPSPTVRELVGALWWLIFAASCVAFGIFLNGCGGSSGHTFDPPIEPCSDCFAGCGAAKSDVEAYHCVWGCNELCAVGRDQ